VNSGDAGFAGAMGAAIEGSLGLDAVPDDRAITVPALWGKRVDRAFEAIEIVRLTMDGYL